MRVQARAVVTRVQRHFQGQPLHLGNSDLPDLGRAGQPVRAQARLTGQRLRRRQKMMHRKPHVKAQSIRESETGAQASLRQQAMSVKGRQAGLPPGQMRRDLEQDFSFVQIFAHMGKIQRLQRAETPRHQAAKSRGTAGREILFLKERHR